MLFLLFIISAGDAFGLSCEDAQKLTPGQQVQCMDIEKGQMAIALGGCKAVDGSGEVFDPRCLRIVRARLMERAIKNYNKTFSYLPKKDRLELWRDCEKTGRYDHLFACLVKNAPPGTIKNQFKLLNDDVAAMLIQSSIEVASRDKLCAASITKGPLFAIKQKIAFPGCDEPIADQTVAVQVGLVQELKTVLDDFECYKNQCNFASLPYKPPQKIDWDALNAYDGDFDKKQVELCEIGFGEKLTKAYSCEPGLSSYFENSSLSPLLNAFSPKKKDFFSGFLEGLRRVYLKNILEAGKRIYGQAPALNKSCARFGKSIPASTENPQDNIAGAFKERPTEIAKMAFVMAESLAGLEKKIEDLETMLSIPDESGMLVAEKMQWMKEMDLHKAAITEIMKAAPFFAEDGARPKDILHHPTELGPVKKMLKSSNKVEAFKTVLKDYEKLIQSEMDRVCSVEPEKIKWRQILLQDELYKQLKHELSAEEKPRLDDFRKCLVDNMNRYATKKGAMYAVALPFSMFAPVIIGPGLVALSATIAADAVILVKKYDHMQEEKAAALDKAKCFSATQGFVCGEDDLKQAESKVLISNLEFAISLGFTSVTNARAAYSVFKTDPKALHLKTVTKEQAALLLDKGIKKVASNNYQGKIFHLGEEAGKGDVAFDVGEVVGQGSFGVVYRVKIKDHSPEAMQQYPHLFVGGKAREDLIIKFPNNMPVPNALDIWKRSVINEIDDSKDIASVLSDSPISGAQILAYNSKAKTPFLIKPFVPAKSIQQIGKEQGALTDIQITALKRDIFDKAQLVYDKKKMGIDIKPFNIAWDAANNRWVMYEINYLPSSIGTFFIGEGFEGYLKTVNGFMNSAK